MKKIVIFVLFVLSITLANAQKTEEPVRIEKLNLKLIDKETKALRINRNEYFKSDSNDAREIVLSYLQAKKDVYGLSNMNDIVIERVVKSPSGEYVYCQQYINNIPVFATNFIVYINNDKEIKYILNEFRNTANAKNISNKVSIDNRDALKIAHEYLNLKEDVVRGSGAELVYFESIDKGLELAWVVYVSAMQSDGHWQVFVSAENGRIIHAVRAGAASNGSGKVFAPNPLVSAGVPYGYNNCYLHGNGANNPCLENQLGQVTLNDLTFENGLYKLKGPYCVIEDIEPPTACNIPELPTPNFHYARGEEEFAAVMCYYHVDLAARRFLQLGYEMPDRLKGLRVDPHGEFGNRSAHYYTYNPYSQASNYLSFGSRICDEYPAFLRPAEDADVIWHEYAHAIQANFIPNGMSYSYETAAVQEGCSDYWSTSYKRSLYPNNWEVCALWFTEGSSLYLRRTDLNLVYPTDYENGNNYANSQIWSSALMKIWGDLGRDVTDQLFLESHLIWGYAPTLREAATAFMQADFHLYNGSHLCQIYSRFQEHGLIDTNQIVKTTSFVNQTVSSDKIVFSCSDLNVQNVNVQNGAKLFLDAAGDVTIQGDFEVALGSELEIK